MTGYDPVAAYEGAVAVVSLLTVAVLSGGFVAFGALRTWIAHRERARGGRR